MQSINKDNNFTVMTEKEARVSILENIQEDLVRIHKEIDLIETTVHSLSELVERENKGYQPEYRKVLTRLKMELRFAITEKQKRLEDFYHYCTH